MAQGTSGLFFIPGEAFPGSEIQLLTSVFLDSGFRGNDGSKVGIDLPFRQGRVTQSQNAVVDCHSGRSVAEIRNPVTGFSGVPGFPLSRE
jgi:hypothetical protein